MRGSKPVTGLDDTIVFSEHLGHVAVFLDKEALLARLSDERSERKEAIVDRFFHLSRDQAFYFTDVYVLAEVLGKVRSGTTAAATVEFMDNISNSAIEIHYGADRWDESVLTQSPKEVFEAGADLIRTANKHDVKFDEATLVLQAITAENGCVLSFDKPVREISRAFDVEVFPYTDNCW